MDRYMLGDDGWIEAYNCSNDPYSDAMTVDQLKALAESYDPEYRRAHIVLSHYPPPGDPGVGLIKAAKVEGDSLYLYAPDIDANVAELIARERYTDVSIAWWWEDERTGGPYLGHCAIVGGGDNPAVGGMSQLTATPGEADPSGMGIARHRTVGQLVMRGKRIAQMERAERPEPDREEGDNPMSDEKKYTEKELRGMVDLHVASETATLLKRTETAEATIKAKDGEIEGYKAKLAGMEIKQAEGEAGAFVDGLVSEGRALNSQKAAIVKVMLALPVEALETYKATLKEAPKVAETGEIATANAARSEGAADESDSAWIEARREAYRAHIETYKRMGITEENFCDPNLRSAFALKLSEGSGK